MFLKSFWFNIKAYMEDHRENVIKIFHILPQEVNDPICITLKL